MLHLLTKVLQVTLRASYYNKWSVVLMALVKGAVMTSTQWPDARLLKVGSKQGREIVAVTATSLEHA